MTTLWKVVVLCLITGISGLLISFTPFVLAIEENIGLGLLFKQRGTRKAPPDVVVVTIDKFSADKLELPNDPEKWPRSLHARLTENLVNAGAEVIAFDITFDEARNDEDDKLFAEVISKARNVILCQSLKKETVHLTDEKGLIVGDINIEKLVQPISPLAQSAVAFAPFPLPKVPARVSQYWKFKASAGDTPTLPVVTFHIFTLKEYDEFIRLLKMFKLSQVDNLPNSKDTIISTRRVVDVIQVLREIIKNEPQIAERMLEELDNSRPLSADVKTNQRIKSLIRMYQRANSQYLNFYGPPRTITTVPYYEVLQLQEKTAAKNQFDFDGKAVFVGSSENFQFEQKDGYYTVFTQSSGLDISGVEIAATAFANLLEAMPVRPLSFRAYLAVIILWAVVVGILCYHFPPVICVPSIIGISVLYFIFALYQFKTTGIWYPLVVPLLFQTPLALIGGIVWQRRNLSMALRYYHPDNLIDEAEKNRVYIKEHNELRYGTFLITDATGYTKLCEKMNQNEEDLTNFLDEYFEVICEQIEQHDGRVMKFEGDSVWALWPTADSKAAQSKKACLSALDIESGVHQFNQSHLDMSLPTRIGLHCGDFLFLKNDFVGDTANTVSRIEGLNKHLGTSILLSEEMLSQLDDFLTRELGEFMLAGKEEPIVIHELNRRKEESKMKERNRCVSFSKALDTFREKRWKEAIEKFALINEKFGKDGPSSFYIGLGKGLYEQYGVEHFKEQWDGVIRMAKK